MKLKRTLYNFLADSQDVCGYHWTARRLRVEEDIHPIEVFFMVVFIAFLWITMTINFVFKVGGVRKHNVPCKCKDYIEANKG